MWFSPLLPGAEIELSAGGALGSGAITEPADTVSGIGSTSTSGSGAITEGADTVSGSGSTATSGQGTVAEAADTVTGVGSTPPVGTGAVVEPADVASGTGTVIDNVQPAGKPTRHAKRRFGVFVNNVLMVFDTKAEADAALKPEPVREKKKPLIRVQGPLAPAKAPVKAPVNVPAKAPQIIELSTLEKLAAHFGSLPAFHARKQNARELVALHDELEAKQQAETREREDFEVVELIKAVHQESIQELMDLVQQLRAVTQFKGKHGKSNDRARVR